MHAALDGVGDPSTKDAVLDLSCRRVGGGRLEQEPEQGGEEEGHRNGEGQGTSTLRLRVKASFNGLFTFPTTKRAVITAGILNELDKGDVRMGDGGGRFFH